MKALFPHGEYKGVEVLHSVEDVPLGTGGAVTEALRRWPARQVCVLNGDSFCHFHVPNLLRFHNEKSAQISLSLLPSCEVSRSGSVELDDQSRVVGFSEKNSSKTRALINAGIYIFETEVFEHFPPEKCFR